MLMFIFLFFMLMMFFRYSRFIIFLMMMETMNVIYFFYLSLVSNLQTSMLCISFFAFSVMTFTVGVSLLVMLSRYFNKEIIYFKMC
uniref:NADH dehydrogenase subunit 4L n=1 Tax=Stenostomum leucops TaxID=52061 RepID=A0A1U9IVY2_9PLAT|nr:NADH dehydrogenase subunit 4L [Stenostomum leucops]